VLDGELSSIPMAVLYDGQHYLIEKYSIATTPGLTLTNPQALQKQKLAGAAFGLTKESTIKLPTGGERYFPPLDAVNDEISKFKEKVPSSIVVKDEQFTRKEFSATLAKASWPIVHLATHGQFSSNLENTFLVMGNNETINTQELATALGGGRSDRVPIELLVLSACETASGDNRAPLGLAGIALRSGAQSTVASLWKVDDQATAKLMEAFYQEIAGRRESKAMALQKAQQKVLETHPNPRDWAPFILVGNWL
jgi:CHAT domain-containing protein